MALPILSVGDALSYAHSKGVIHRDVKPQNVVVDERCNAKLTDFDLIWVADTTGGTRTGALGTFVYAAPECLKDASQATPASDVFSLAMLTVFVLSGAELEFEVFRDPGKHIRSIDGVPHEVKEVLVRATEWKLSKRTQTVATFLAQLRESLNVNDLPRGLDDVGWLDRGNFTATCVNRYRSAYAEVRASQNWTRIPEAASELALLAFNGFREAFETGSLPFGSEGTIKNYIGGYPIGRLDAFAIQGVTQ